MSGPNNQHRCLRKKQRLVLGVDILGMPQRHRVFIAINFPEDIKKKLATYQEKWPELPARWTKKESLHITLVFLGYISDEEIVETCKIVKEVAQKHQPFSISLNKVCYGPPQNQNKPPRMVWAEGDKSADLARLKNDLEKSLVGKVNFSLENREFSPHITLSRIKTWEWKKIEPEERPDIEENIDLSFSVESIEIMESELKRGGAEYIVLESIQLGQI